MLELIIHKKKKTKVILDGKDYLPSESLEESDFYRLPCDDGRVHNLEVVHYAGTSPDGVLAVIGDRPTPARSVLREMRSASTNLYFCRLKMKIAAKMDAVLQCFVNRICTIDKWGQTSYCSIHAEGNERAHVLSRKLEYYPSRDARKQLLAIETGLTIANVILYTELVLVLALLVASSLVNIFVGVTLLAVLVPLGLAGLIVLAWRTVNCYKHSGPPEHSKKRK